MEIRARIEKAVMAAAIVATVGCMAYGVAMTVHGLYKAAPTTWSYVKAISTGQFELAKPEQYSDNECMTDTECEQ